MNKIKIISDKNRNSIRIKKSLSKIIQNSKLRKSDNKNSEYSGYFWYDKKNKTRHAEMRGHGSQKIYIDLEKNKVLTYLRNIF